MSVKGFSVGNIFYINPVEHFELATVYIEEGKIAWIKRALKEMDQPQNHDLLLPGRLYDRPLSGIRYRGKTYRRMMRELIREGYTSFIDTVDFDGIGDPVEEIRYVEALHADSPLDYGLRIRMPAHRLTPRHLSKIADLGVKEVILTLQEGLTRIKLAWERIAEYRNYYDLHLSIFFPTRKLLFLRQKKIEEMFNYWYYVNENAHLSFDLPDSTNFDIMHQEKVPDRIKAERDQSIHRIKRAGFFPRKGSLMVGSDADLLLMTYEDFVKGLHQPKVLFLRGKRLFPHDPLPFGQGRRLRGFRSFASAHDKQL